ncbi:MAG: O-antigen ligase family protein [Actinomycetota bacterium]|nr:O-antigen ligase family protein [Actinomycetota bacterium]
MTAGVIAIVGTLLSFALLVPTVLQAALDVPVITETVGATGSTRAYMWQAAGDIVAEHPILGTGPDSYRYESQPFLVAELHDIEHGATPLTALPPQPHSVFWDLAVSTGGMGLLAAGLLLVAWARSVKARTDASPEAADLRMGLAIGFLGGAFVSLFVPYNIIPAATLPLLAGLAAAGGSMRDSPPTERPLLRHVLSSALALLMVLFATTTYLGARSYRKALDAPVASVAAASLDDAVSYRPGESPYRFLRLWQIGSVSRSEQEIRSFQEAVDSESALVKGYAPYVVEFVRISLDQAAATGRSDLSWEEDALARMRIICPTLPELYAEELHVALVGADADEIADVLGVVEEFAVAAPQFDRYLPTARAIVEDR